MEVVLSITLPLLADMIHTMPSFKQRISTGSIRLDRYGHGFINCLASESFVVTSS